MAQHFIEWLQNQIKKRSWSQTDLRQRANMAGYPMSSSQLSNILSGNRGAGPDMCIAIAHALSLPREEVFRARGWLLEEPELLIPPQATPNAIKLIRDLTGLDDENQVMASGALQHQLDVIISLLPLTQSDNESA